MTAARLAADPRASRADSGQIRVIEHPKVAYEDSKSDWPWVMVPQGECRKLLLDLDKAAPVRLGNVDEQGNSGSLLNTYFQAKLTGNELQICGLDYPFDTKDRPVDVYQPGRRLRIWVSVRKRRNVPIVVHYVDHGAIIENGRELVTRTTRDQLHEMIAVANSILVPQANVGLSVALERRLGPNQFGESLGFIVSRREVYKYLFPHKIDVRAMTYELEPMNLFLVRLGHTGPEPELARYFREDKSCVLEDHLSHGELATGGGGKTLAHEVGHHLGLYHHNNIEYLMYGGGLRTGDKLYRFEIDTMSGSRAIKRQSPPLGTW